MRNLVLLRDERRRHHVVSPPPPHTPPTTTIPWALDPVQGLGYMLLPATGALLACTDKGGEEALWSVPLLPEGQEGAQRTWLAALYLAERNAVLCVAGEGELVTVDCESKDVVLVGMVDCGLKAASQSPDEELLVFITGAQTLLCMTPGDLDVLHETPLVHALASNGDKPLLSWSGDGSFVAVLGEEVGDGEGERRRRCLRVYQRQDEGLALHAVGRHEDESAVEGVGGQALAWATDGSLIAAVQTTKGRINYPPTHPPTSTSIYLQIHPFTRVPTYILYPFTHLPTYLPTHSKGGEEDSLIHPPTHYLCTHSIHPPTHLPTQ